MKITKVDVWVLDAGEQRGARYPICCRVYTDEGIYGDGEAGVAYGTGYTAAYGMIIDMAHHIIGMDPMNTELIWETILKGTFWGQGGGVVVFSGMSAPGHRSVGHQGQGSGRAHLPAAGRQVP